MKLLNKLIVILFLSVFMNCGLADAFRQWVSPPESAPIQFKHYDPESKTGCETTTGRKWFLCMKELSQKWQAIESSEPVTTVMETSRQGDFILETKRTCWSEYFCRYYMVSRYDPKFSNLLKKYGTVAIIAALIGAGAGYNAGQSLQWGLTKAFGLP